MLKIKDETFIDIKGYDGRYKSSYDMWDKEGHHYHFTAMPYSEAREKGLIRREREDWER